MVPPGEAAAQASRTIEAYVGGDLGFTRGDLSSVRRGRVVTRIVDTDDPQEIAVASVARVPATLERFMVEAGDAARLMRGRSVGLAHAVSEPSLRADFRDLTLPEGDLEDLERCKPGDCRVKLPERSIQFLAKLDWAGAVPRREAEEHVRTMLQDFADRFRDGRPLPPYADKRRPVDPRAGFTSIVSRHPYFLGHLPRLRDHVTNFPGGPEVDAPGTLLWMEERFGLKPVLSLDHVLLHRPQRQGAVDAIVTVEQLYASHYFEASLSMIAFVYAEEEPGSWFIHIRHHRFDGTLSAGQRRLIERQIRSYVEDFVTERVARLERSP